MISAIFDLFLLLTLLLVNYGSISQFSESVVQVGQAQVTPQVTLTLQVTPTLTPISTPTLQPAAPLNTATTSATTSSPRPSILEYVTAFGTIATPIVKSRPHVYQR